MNPNFIPNIEYARWDTEYFNVKVGILCIPSSISLTIEMLDSLSDQAKEEKYKVLYIMLLDDGIIQMPPNYNNPALLFADRKIVYSKSIFCDKGIDIPEVESYSELCSYSELYTLAIESGNFSRFKLDSHFPANTFEIMYRVWIEKSISKEIADDIFVYRKGGHVMGMLTYKCSKNQGNVGLIAVSPVQQHLGIGSKLIHRLETHLFKSGINELDVATQGANIQACRFYEKNGFAVKKIINIYHLWV